MRSGLPLLLFATLALVPALRATAQGTEAQPFTFELPEHPGLLRLNEFHFEVTEMSAKTNGHEFGIRADEQNKVGDKLHFLGFLFAWPEAQPLTSAGCRDRMLTEEAAKQPKNILGKRIIQTSNGVDVAVVNYTHVGKGNPEYQHVNRAFVAQGDLCADLEFSSAGEPDPKRLDEIFRNVVFEPEAKPEFWGQFLYAKVLEQHGELAPAAHVYTLALGNASQAREPLQWQRIATDQASMAYGMAGDLKQSRALNQAAIARDPDYPLYYYNLACADAEEGKAEDAKTHLQEAYARRANTLKGEHLPDATKDDSILKLKSDTAFWNFVQGLPKP